MKHFIKQKSGSWFEAFTEVWSNEEMDWVTVCEAKLAIPSNNECLVDIIETKQKYRRNGYAKALVQHLQTKFDYVAPIGIVDSEEAHGFWKSLGMEDALGPEE